jgi:hypothetical protein
MEIIEGSRREGLEEVFLPLAVERLAGAPADIRRKEGRFEVRAQRLEQ